MSEYIPEGIQIIGAKCFTMVYYIVYIQGAVHDISLGYWVSYFRKIVCRTL